MQSFIIATAGHIDHGKTALVQALTGVNTDVLKEEKRRGITIRLGYAPFNISDQCVAGIVDVPGHHRLIKTMVMGATQTTLALFIIAANEGIQPQTREHLNILSLLGVQKGIIVVTKKDLVSKEELSHRREQIEAFAKGTFLENAALIETSSKTGEGISVLKEAISETFKRLQLENPYRLKKECLLKVPIDRVFTVKGMGTVITGPLLCGEIKQDDEVTIYPQKRKVRVRQIEAYGQQFNSVAAPSRVALNVKGVEKQEIKSGDVIGKGLDITDRIYARITFFSHHKVRSAMLHVHTKRVKVTLKQLDQSDIFYIRLASPIVVLSGDRFVLRTDETIGGGEVLDAFPVKKHQWRNKDRAQPESYVLSFFKEQPDKKWTVNELQLKTGFSVRELTKHLANLAPAIIETEKGQYIQKSVYDRKNELSGEDDLSQRAVDALMHEINASQEGWRPAVLSAKSDPKVLHYLISSDQVYRMPEGFYLSKDQYERVKAEVKNYFNNHTEMRVGDVKKIFDLSRKFAIPYLQFFDAQKWTIRKEGVRTRWKI